MGTSRTEPRRPSCHDGRPPEACVWSTRGGGSRPPRGGSRALFFILDKVRTCPVIAFDRARKTNENNEVVPAQRPRCEVMMQLIKPFPYRRLDMSETLLHAPPADRKLAAETRHHRPV